MKTIIGYKLPSNYRLLEPNTVANIYYHLREKYNITLMLEVRLPTSYSKRGNLRADLGLVHKGVVIAVVEVKRSNISDEAFQKNKVARNGKQFRKYKEMEENFGIKVFFANNKTPVEKLGKSLNKILNSYMKSLRNAKST